MRTKNLRLAVVVVLILGVALVLPCSDVFAAQHRGGGRGHDNGGDYAWIGVAVAGALLGVALLAAAAQPQYQVVYMPGNPVPYYYANGRYYQKDACGNYYPVQPVQYVQPVPMAVQQPVAYCQ